MNVDDDRSGNIIILVKVLSARTNVSVRFNLTRPNLQNFKARLIRNPWNKNSKQRKMIFSVEENDFLGAITRDRFIIITK